MKLLNLYLGWFDEIKRQVCNGNVQELVFGRFRGHLPLSEKMIAPDVPIYLRKRYYVMMMLLIGEILIYMAKMNLSICLIDMTSPKTITIGNTTYIQEAKFNLTSVQKGIILSAHSWGFITAPIPAVLSNKFGGISSFNASLLLTGLLSILSPMVFQWNMNAFILIRILEGFVQGIMSTSLFTTCVKWAVPKERSRMINYSLLGIGIGSALSHPVTGLITHFFDWTYVFYITGVLALVAFFLCCCTIKNSPTEDKFITRAEKAHFKAVCQEVQQEKVVVPWKLMMTSAPVLAYMNDRFVESWSFSFLLTCLPLYIKDAYPSSIKDIGILSGVPHVLNILAIIISSWLMDYLRSTKKKNKTKLHKMFIMIGQVPSAGLLILLGFWNDFSLALITLSVFRVCYSTAYASYFTLPFDMSLEHASVLEGVGISFNCVGGTLNPIVMGYMVQNHLPEEWSRYFWFLSIFNLWGVIIFAKYGSGEVQPWAHSYKRTEEKHSTTDG